MSRIEHYNTKAISSDGVRHNEINPSGQSYLVDFKTQVVIARPLCERFSGLDREEELARRVEAVKLHQKELPEHTLPVQHVLLEGEKVTNRVPFPTPILGRVSPKMKQVQEISKMSPDEILSDSNLCRDLGGIYFIYFKIFLKKGILFDSGSSGQLNTDLPPLLRRPFALMVSNNIMVGRDNLGNRRVFCDPDWFFKSEDVKTNSCLERIGIKIKFTKSAIASLLRSIFFFSAANMGRPRSSRQNKMPSLVSE